MLEFNAGNALVAYVTTENEELTTKNEKLKELVKTLEKKLYSKKDSQICDLKEDNRRKDTRFERCARELQETKNELENERRKRRNMEKTLKRKVQGSIIINKNLLKLFLKVAF